MAAPNFNDYVTKLYPHAIANVRTMVDVPLMFSFERLVQKVMFLLEFGDMPIPDDANGRAFCDLVAKGISESRAFISCVRDANIWSAYSHTRSLIELLASTHHLVGAPDDRARRLDKYSTYPNLRALKPHLRAMERIRKNKLTKEEYENTRMLTPARLEQLEVHKPRMIELWGQDLLTVNRWHHPHSMSHLIRDLNQPIQLSENVRNHDWTSRYEHLNHATHPSPTGHYVVGGANNPLLSVKRPDLLPGEIVSAAEAFLSSLARWDRYLVPDCGLLKRASREHDGYHESAMDIGRSARRRR